MSEETRLLHISDVPSTLHDEIAEHLSLYSVGFSAIRVTTRGEQSAASGSGTLVHVDGRRTVLTADHVAEQLERANRISLLIDWSGGLRRCAFERTHLSFARLARGTDDGEGPDLALIFLPQADEAVSSLGAHKCFYNLDRRIEMLGCNFPGLEYGFWFPCGVPAEGSRELEPMRCFARARGAWGLCAIAGRPTEFQRDGFDYLDFNVPESGKDIPSSLGGMSGAGLWQVRLRQRSDGEIYVQDYFLAGVVFYEWYPPARHLRCHGRRSLHERLPELISDWRRSTNDGR